MAKAKKIVPKPKPYEVELILTEKEACALRAVCWRIGGSSENTRRRHFDAIAEALDEAGVNDEEPTDIHESHRAIYFV